MDTRWLYWEPDHKLLNRARREMMPWWIGVEGQHAHIMPQTPRRPGAARPVASTAVPCFEAADPNARVFPLWLPTSSLGLAPGELGYEESDIQLGPNVRTEWVDAARAIGLDGDSTELAETIFFGLLGVTASGVWLASQPVEHDDFPEIALPTDAGLLVRCAALGRRYADLCDPLVPVDGVTVGQVSGEWAAVGAPDAASGLVTLEYGRASFEGGEHDGTSVFWAGESGWRDIPDEVWTSASAGSQYSRSGFRTASDAL